MSEIRFRAKRFLRGAEPSTRKLVRQYVREVEAAGLASVADLLNQSESELIAPDLRSLCVWLAVRLAEPSDHGSLVEHLRVLMDSPTTEVRAAAADGLTVLPEALALDAIPDLSRLVTDNETEVRTHAIRALAALGATESLPILSGIMQDHNEPSEIRGLAAEALGEIGGSSVRELLELAASDSDPEVRRWARFALVEIGKFETYDRDHG